MTALAASAPAAGQAAQTAPADEAEQRALAAVLRWRARPLLARLGGELAAAARLAPVLLQASLPHPLLRAEAPGVVGQQRFRRSWGGWARQCGLPPPLSMQKGRGLIDAVVLLQRSAGALVLVFATPGLRAPVRAKVTERVVAASSVLGAGGRPLEVRLAPEGPLADLERDECLLFGALLAGALPPALADERPAADPRALAVELAVRAPNEVAAMALMLLAAQAGPPVVRALRTALGAGIPSQRLAEPAEACVRWAGPATGQGALLETLLGWSRLAAGADGDRPSTSELMTGGRTLALACAAAVRTVPAARAAALRTRLRHQVIGPGLPRVLLPLLAGDELRFEPAALEKRRGYKVRTADGTVFGNGRTLMQARVRALALRATGQRAPAGSSALNALIEQRLARPIEKPTLFMIVEPVNRPGPPFDPLNRGPERAIALLSATAVRLHPGGRPSASRLRPIDAVRRLCQDAIAGLELEVVALTPDGSAVVARLLRVAALAKKSKQHPVAIEVGGEVLAPHDGRMRRFPLRTFARRPVGCAPDPEAFDLALSPERGLRAHGGPAQPRLLEMRVYQVSDTLGCVLTCDSSGRMLRQELRLDRIEDHLREARELLRACNPPALLAARLADQLETVLQMHTRALPPLVLSVGGALPRGLWVDYGGERFQLSSRGELSAAAQALLSSVQQGGEARLSIEKVTVSLPDREPAPPLLQLYARSLVLRRLGAQLRRELSPFPGATLIEC